MAEQSRGKSKFEKEFDEINSSKKTLEEQESEIVQNYQMKEGDYKIIITIYEASDLIPKPAEFILYTFQKSACSAFVEVEIMGQKKKTPVRDGTNNPIWQEPFYFSFSNLSVQELDRLKIVFNVFDKNNPFIPNSLLGTFECDWTSIYFRRFHQIYRGWLTLSDPLDQIEGPVGYLLVNIAVLGPDDKIMVHDSAFIKDPLTTIEDTITNVKTPQIDYSITAQIYRAESLIPLDLASRSVDAFVVAKFSGQKVSSQIVSSLNPQWNEALKIGAGVPNKTKYLLLEVWNRNRLGKNDLIGVIKVPFIDVQEDRYLQPRWGHLYGPPMSAVDKQPSNYATKMQVYGPELGSHYRGRLLFKVVGKKYIHTATGTNKIQFKFPFKPTPAVPLKTYTLSAQLIEGFQLPQRPEAHIHIAIGQYLIKSKQHQVSKRVCEFMEILQDKKVQFAEDIQQVPDVIIYFCEGKQENQRMSFIRIKASTVITGSRHKHPKIYPLEVDRSLELLRPEEIGGYITTRINLYTNASPAHKSIESDYKEKVSYSLQIYLYKGEGFPPANMEGDCDPFLTFNCAGTKKDSDVKEGSFNPFWQQTIEMDLQIQDLISTNITKGIVCEAFDHEESGKHQYIGSFLIEANSTLLREMKPQPSKDEKKFGDKKLTEKNLEFLYQRPKWYYVQNPHVQIGKHIFGKVLLSFALFRKQDIAKNRVPPQFLGKQKLDLIPKQEKNVQIYLIGLRDIRDSNKRILSKGLAEVNMFLGSDTFSSGKVQLKRSGCEINRLLEKKLNLPKNKSLIPFVDFKVTHNGAFYGYNSVSLYQLLPKLKEKEGQRNQNYQESDETIIDVEGLQQQIQMLKQKRKQDKLNLQLGAGNEGGKIQDLVPPLELAMIGRAAENKKDNQIELNQLLENFEKNYKDSPSYEYVRKLQKLRDSRQQSFKQLEQKKQSLHLTVNRMTNNQLDVQRGSIMEESISKDVKIGNQNKKSLETVFDQIKKKKVDKLEKKSGEQSFVKTNLDEKEAKTLKPINSMEIRLQEKQEEQIPFQKSQVEPSKQLDIGERNKQQKIKSIKVANSEQDVLKHAREAASRYTIKGRATINDRKSQKSLNAIAQQSEENKVHIDIRTDQQFSDVPVEERAINYKDVQRVMVQEEKDEKQARQRDEEYRFANAVKLTLFGWNRKKKRRNIETYEDFDSEDGQDLNIIPQWYKGRKILTSDFQDLNFKATKIQTVPLFGGQKIQNSNFQSKKKESAGHIKMIVMSETSEVAKEKDEYYTKLLKPKEYYCRIYILKGKSLISGYDTKPSTYLRFTYADQTVSLRDTTYKESQANPEYYILHELPLQLPGPCMVKVQVMETHNIFGKLIDKVLGYTEIDLQQRYFMKKWHMYDKKPIELRNLYSEYGLGSQGRIQTFIQLIEKKKWLNTPPHPIAPPPFYAYQLRIIVWKTDDCVFKNVQMESNDIYVRGSLGTSEFQETDTHWACRSVGNFNYRFKFPINYPSKPEDMYSDQFTIQIWDRDIVGMNNLIGQKRINLHTMHRIIQKAVKRRKAVEAKMKILENNLAITNRFWFDVYNSKEKDEFGIPQPQGRVQLSFELVPAEAAQKQKANGHGRSEPNVYPTLSDPEGRLQFDFFSPLSFIKQIIGPKLFARWCCKLLCCLLLVLVVLFGYIFLPALLAVKI